MACFGRENPKLPFDSTPKHKFTARLRLSRPEGGFFLALFLAQSQPSRAALAVRPGTAGHAGSETASAPRSGKHGGLRRGLVCQSDVKQIWQALPFSFHFPEGRGSIAERVLGQPCPAKKGQPALASLPELD